MEAAKRQLGVDWGIHGSDYLLLHHLYALGSLTRVEWSETAAINRRGIQGLTELEWARKLDAYLKQVGQLKPSCVTTPSWHLACLYF